jgi:site-specific DNA-cytosine methylase
MNGISFLCSHCCQISKKPKNNLKKQLKKTITLTRAHELTKLEAAVRQASNDFHNKIRGGWLFRQNTRMIENIQPGKRVKIVENLGKYDTICEIVDVKGDHTLHHGIRVTVRHEDSNTFEPNLDLAKIDFTYVTDKYRRPRHEHGEMIDRKAQKQERNNDEDMYGGGWVCCELCQDWFEMTYDPNKRWEGNESFQCICFGLHCRSSSAAPPKLKNILCRCCGASHAISSLDGPVVGAVNFSCASVGMECGFEQSDADKIHNHNQLGRLLNGCASNGGGAVGASSNNRPIHQQPPLPIPISIPPPPLVPSASCSSSSSSSSPLVPVASLTSAPSSSSSSSSSSSIKLLAKASQPPARTFVCDLFCGIGLSTHGFALAGIKSFLAIDCDADALHNHWLNHGDTAHGDPPMIITSATTDKDILIYMKKQPPLSCVHFVARIGTNVSQSWYSTMHKKHVSLANISQHLFLKIVRYKRQLMVAELPINTPLHLIGIATPPCYDLSVANPTRSEDVAFQTMTSAFELLHHALCENLLATYAIEQVAHARHSLLVQWARSGNRRNKLVWDYILGSCLNCPTNRERCIFKPCRAKFDTPVRLGPSILDMNIGMVLGISESNRRFGLKGTTWGNLTGATLSMNKRGFTITGSLPRLHYVDSEGHVLQEERARTLTCDEQLGLMGFPPSLRALMKWQSQSNKAQKAKWIGSGVPLQMGVAVASCMLDFVTKGEHQNQTAALLHHVSNDFVYNTPCFKEF